MLDNFVGGAVSEGTTVLDSAVKEAKEEANVPLELALQLQPAGSVSFFHQSDRGIHPNTEFVFDLELPQQFQPLNNDGEVESWQLVPVEKILGIICQPDLFKITSSPVVIDWLIRRGNYSATNSEGNICLLAGIINIDNQPDLPNIVELIHFPLQEFFK